MNFCPKCEFMLFTKINQETNTLQHHCKNCFWIGDYIKEEDSENTQNRITVYKKQYNNDFISNSISKNPYIIYDHTLPRINNIKCINENCISNIQNKNAIKLILDYTNDIEEDIINNVRKPNIKVTCSKFLKSNTIKHKKKNIIPISKNTCIVNLISNSDKQSLLQIPTPTFDNYSFTIKEFIPVDNEIIFMKYNDKELKYMYICSHCKSSWTNEPNTL